VERKRYLKLIDGASMGFLVVSNGNVKDKVRKAKLALLGRVKKKYSNLNKK
jgi:hypothetical protein